MSDNTVKGQVRAYLSDAHSIEEQALAQLRSAPDYAGGQEGQNGVHGPGSAYPLRGRRNP